ncbi:uncharacterized protein LOC125499607 [Beta vulgaris subsp. vulgaris]|uniref:uncharacterized protein LOC125499607 n=1 Tax=Beta vulgaris subsp. vulgaris TaxID=3555 RepID=UPI002036BF01|nr:uncharacterized protein LOC125499607 [Beta vulgaris subsp. vulgaris]
MVSKSLLRQWPPYHGVTILNTRSHQLQLTDIYKSPTSFAVSWQPPPPNYFKLNFNGSVIDSSVAAGVAIRNSADGLLVAAQVYQFGQTSALLIAEARGLRNGLILAIQHYVHSRSIY